jgi:hypothetical protein
LVALAFGCTAVVESASASAEAVFVTSSSAVAGKGTRNRGIFANGISSSNDGNNNDDDEGRVTAASVTGNQGWFRVPLRFAALSFWALSGVYLTLHSNQLRSDTPASLLAECGDAIGVYFVVSIHGRTIVDTTLRVVSYALSEERA